MTNRWLRGNLHAHTTLSDGSHSLPDLIDTYQKLGYDFLAVTDHDLVAPLDAVRASTSMLLVSGDEITANGSHVCLLGVETAPRPEADRQPAIDEMLAQQALVVMNHPNWQRDRDHWSQQELERLQGYTGIEIFNGIVQFIEGDPCATDRWDRLLSTGRRLWGFANDDTHFAGGVGCGWNMVRWPADEAPTWPALRSALVAGDFYASTGVILSEIDWDGQTMRVSSENAEQIRFVGSGGRTLATADGGEASFTVHGPELYVRAEAFGPHGTMAWTQPVFP